VLRVKDGANLLCIVMLLTNLPMPRLKGHAPHIDSLSRSVVTMLLSRLPEQQSIASDSQKLIGVYATIASQLRE
jgi:hypothetical protein